MNATLTHGTTKGYRTHGCKCDKCRAAVTRAEKVYRMRVTANGPRMVDITGTRRRLLALGVAGWSQRQIATETGLTQRTIGRLSIGRVEAVHVDTAETIRKAFDRLAMRPAPANPLATRTARANGGHPPLAWDDDTIDDPTAGPFLDEADTVDEVAIARAVNGIPTRLTRAERHEVVKALAPRGLADSDIARRCEVVTETIQRDRDELGIESRWTRDMSHDYGRHVA